jgi:hypothetical protein
VGRRVERGRVGFGLLVVGLTVAAAGAAKSVAPAKGVLMLGDAGAETRPAEARDLFASMGYETALAETEALLGYPRREEQPTQPVRAEAGRFTRLTWIG